MSLPHKAARSLLAVTLAVTASWVSVPHTMPVQPRVAPLAAPLRPPSRIFTVRASRTRTLVPKKIVKTPTPVTPSVVSWASMMDVTSYCTSGTMANGSITHVGVAATLSRRIPFGSIAVLANGSRYVVEDRIGSGSDLDLYSTSCAAATRFGRQRQVVRLIFATR